MSRTTRMGIRGPLLSVVALTLSAVAAGQTPAPQDGGVEQRRIVIVPASPTDPAQASQAPGAGATQQRIVVVPANPGAAAQGTQQRIVIVPANPGAANQPAQTPDAGATQQRIVIVPANPGATDQTGQTSGPPQQQIVVVPANPGATDQTGHASGSPQQQIVIVPQQPQPQQTESPPNGSGSDQQIVAQPVPGSEAAPQDQGAGAGTEQNAPASDDSGTAAAQEDSGGQGSGDHTVTATPDLTPRPTGDVANTTPSPPPPAVTPAAPNGFTDGHVRLGPFLSGPGSLTFILHHTLMGAAGGFATQGISNDFGSDTGTREAILAGTLVGAGIGFGTSSWWQFNHWMGKNTANFGVVNSLSGGMFLTGLLDLTTDDPTALAWSSFVGAELGAWMTAGIGGGELSLETGLLTASGQAWGAIYGSLLLAIVRFSGSSLRTESAIDALFISQGVGAILATFAAGHFHPSTQQILRADVSGAIVGGAVLLLSALVLGHLDSPTPYVLSMASSATTMALVSIFWDTGAEKPAVSLGGSKTAAYRSLW